MAKERSDDGDKKPKRARKPIKREGIGGRAATVRRGAEEARVEMPSPLPRRGRARQARAETQPAQAEAQPARAEAQPASPSMSGNDERRRVIEATMLLAAAQGWTSLSMQDIARESGVPLARLRARYPSKGVILADFIKSIDEAVLTRIEREASRDEAATPRDRLFDVLMMRLEALEPHRAGLKAVFRDVASTLDGLPAVFVTQLHSRRWMLAAAGVDTRGLDGAMKATGLGVIYGRVLRVWFEEEDPGLPKTMAELDRQLHRGMQALRRLDGPIAMLGATARVACSVGQQMLGLGKEYRRKRQQRREQRAGEAGAAS